MLVNKSVETTNGTVKFEGELSSAEVDMVLQIGLNFLLQQGAIPYTIKSEADLIIPETEYDQ